MIVLDPERRQAVDDAALMARLTAKFVACGLNIEGGEFANLSSDDTKLLLFAALHTAELIERARTSFG